MSEKSWAERHPIITGALVGSIVPGIGTLAGALGGIIYDVVERNSADKNDPNEQHQAINPVFPEEEKKEEAKK